MDRVEEDVYVCLFLVYTTLSCKTSIDCNVFVQMYSSFCARMFSISYGCSGFVQYAMHVSEVLLMVGEYF